MREKSNNYLTRIKLKNTGKVLLFAFSILKINQLKH